MAVAAAIQLSGGNSHRPRMQQTTRHQRVASASSATMAAKSPMSTPLVGAVTVATAGEIASAASSKSRAQASRNGEINPSTAATAPTTHHRHHRSSLHHHHHHHHHHQRLSDKKKNNNNPSVNTAAAHSSIPGLHRRRWQSSLGALTTTTSTTASTLIKPLTTTTTTGKQQIPQQTSISKLGSHSNVKRPPLVQLHQCAVGSGSNSATLSTTGERRRRTQALAQSLVKIAPVSGTVVHTNQASAPSNTSSRLRQAALYARRHCRLHSRSQLDLLSNRSTDKATSADSSWSTATGNGNKWRDLTASSSSLASSGGTSASAIVKRPKSSPTAVVKLSPRIPASKSKRPEQQKATAATTTTTPASYSRARRMTAADRRGPIILTSGARKTPNSKSLIINPATTTTATITKRNNLLQKEQQQRQATVHLQLGTIELSSGAPDTTAAALEQARVTAQCDRLLSSEQNDDRQQQLLSTSTTTTNTETAQNITFNPLSPTTLNQPASLIIISASNAADDNGNISAISNGQLLAATSNKRVDTRQPDNKMTPNTLIEDVESRLLNNDENNEPILIEQTCNGTNGQKSFHDNTINSHTPQQQQQNSATNVLQLFSSSLNANNNNNNNNTIIDHKDDIDPSKQVTMQTQNDDGDIIKQKDNNNTINVNKYADNNIEFNVRLEPICDYYDLEARPFARGKFAQVKRCIDKSSKQCFAAKCIKKRRRLVDIRHEILLEIEALKLSYYTKHIVQLFDVFETPNEMILVLEMANGGELQRVLDDEEIIEEPIACRMVSQILDGLICLHDNCIAHLDLKPQNILLTSLFPNGDVKLCDFGISRRITNDCEIREICGTPDYVAPEILRYDPISLATDMWSLGVLTYVLLSGYSPFGSENKQQTYCNITQATLEFPCEIFDRVSQEAIDFICRLIVLDPTKRLTSRQARQHRWLIGAQQKPLP